jgi:hypothetical protein
MMRDRLEMLRRLLAVDGSIWISVDDNEAHYLKVLCDEIFGSISEGEHIAELLRGQQPGGVSRRAAQQRHAPDAPLRSLSCTLNGGAGDAGRYAAHQKHGD